MTAVKTGGIGSFALVRGSPKSKSLEGGQVKIIKPPVKGVFGPVY